MAETGSVVKTVILAAALTASVCGLTHAFPAAVKDDRGRVIEVTERPRRIISLAPTQTELLYSLGLDKEVVGVTSYCSYPGAAGQKETVGGFAELDVDRISALEPDLVLAFGTVQLGTVEALEKKGRRVFWIYPRTVGDILASFERVGKITGKAREGKRLRETTERRLGILRSKLGDISDDKRPTIFRVMGMEPPATIGADSFQSDVFFLAGGKNAFADVQKDFFEVDARELIRRDPDVILMCGKDETAARHKLAESPVFSGLTAVKKGAVLVLPCDLTCRPGPRVPETVERIARYLYPDRFTGSSESAEARGGETERTGTR